MSLLIFALVVLIVVALALWVVRSIAIPSPFNWIIQVVIVLIAIWVIAQRAGVLNG